MTRLNDEAWRLANALPTDADDERLVDSLMARREFRVRVHKEALEDAREVSLRATARIVLICVSITAVSLTVAGLMSCLWWFK